MGTGKGGVRSRHFNRLSHPHSPGSGPTGRASTALGTAGIQNRPGKASGATSKYDRLPGRPLRELTSATMSIAKECGYKGAFSFRTGENEPAAMDPYDIRRISAGDRL